MDSLRKLGWGLLVLAMVTASNLALAGEEVIRIVTPQWEGQTNEDGTGLFFEILREVYEPEGIRLEIRFAPWKRCRTMVSSGLGDAMPCVWEREAIEMGQLVPSLPLYVEKTAAVIKKASGINWQGLHTLDYRRAVWLRGYNYHVDPHMEGIQLALWHEVNTQKEAWRQLNSDRFDVLMDALIDVRRYMKTNHSEAFLYNIHILWQDKAYVAFSDSDRSRRLIQIFDQKLRALRDSGRLAGIYQKWGEAFDPVHWSD